MIVHFQVPAFGEWIERPTHHVRLRHTAKRIKGRTYYTLVDHDTGDPLCVSNECGEEAYAHFMEHEMVLPLMKRLKLLNSPPPVPLPIGYKQPVLAEDRDGLS